MVHYISVGSIEVDWTLDQNYKMHAMCVSVDRYVFARVNVFVSFEWEWLLSKLISKRVFFSKEYFLTNR